eukprot:CAMPEP_0170176116 /NCGR_PEP_ID=MMETSP0040_2-20121228/9064_1 /TAXON_ID=641309 /ORGANISM="Lotharella oceanica, Strain CCMP622" /LENGTH=188 /DNA_ID=CAMNT_0010418337 /DNA_START=204 /DNA_END=769 /DNA_ORIENTATION=+
MLAKVPESLCIGRGGHRSRGCGLSAQEKNTSSRKSGKNPNEPSKSLRNASTDKASTIESSEERTPIKATELESSGRKAAIRFMSAFNLDETQHYVSKKKKRRRKKKKRRKHAGDSSSVEFKLLEDTRSENEGGEANKEKLLRVHALHFMHEAHDSSAAEFSHQLCMQQSSRKAHAVAAGTCQHLEHND